MEIFLFLFILAGFIILIMPILRGSRKNNKSTLSDLGNINSTGDESKESHENISNHKQPIEKEVSNNKTQDTNMKSQSDFEDDSKESHENISNHKQPIEKEVSNNKTQDTNIKSQSDFESDLYYQVLDILYENTKPILGMGLNNLTQLENFEDLLVKSRILRIANSQRNLTDKQIERLVRDLSPQKFKELMLLMQQIDSPEIVNYYNQLCKGINDNTVIAMRVIAYGISREEAQKQVAAVDSFLGL
jgi:hypothetical protein